LSYFALREKRRDVVEARRAEAAVEGLDATRVEVRKARSEAVGSILMIR
jgi:hypothetical protein